MSSRHPYHGGPRTRTTSDVMGVGVGVSPDNKDRHREKAHAIIDSEGETDGRDVDVDVDDDMDVDVDVDADDPNNNNREEDEEDVDEEDEEENEGLDDDDDDDIANEPQDPLGRAIDELEDRCVSALDAFRLHDGVRSSAGTSSSNSSSLEENQNSVAEELEELIRPCVEVAAHVGPAMARTHAAYRPMGGVDEATEEVYQRLNVDTIYSTVTEVASTDPIPVKRTAVLSFCRTLYRECRAAGAGGYFGGSSGGSGSGGANANRSVTTTAQRRREGDLLHVWCEASSACLALGAFSNDRSDATVAGRAVLAANAAVRPALRHVATHIRAADDAAATRLYLPILRMAEGVTSRLVHHRSHSTSGGNGNPNYTKNHNHADHLVSPCLKFLETLALCTSTRPASTIRAARGGRGGGEHSHYYHQQQQQQPYGDRNDFSLDDMPMGHPIVTRDALEEIGELAFTVLRGLVLMGGQVAIDPHLVELASNDNNNNNSAFQPHRVLVNLLKPLALAFLEVESSVTEGILPDPQKQKTTNKGPVSNTTSDSLSTTMRQADAKGDVGVDVDVGVGVDAGMKNAKEKDNDDDDKAKNKEEEHEHNYKETKAHRESVRKKIELSFRLGQKSHSVAINAVSIVGTSRPGHTVAAATTLSQRCLDPPTYLPGASSQKNSSAALLSIGSHLRSACLSLLRQPVAIADLASYPLKYALGRQNMATQAEAAHRAALHLAELRKASRGIRNRAALNYEWDYSSSSSSLSAMHMHMNSLLMQSSAEGRKRRRQETDDALKRMRAAKAARGLGRGIPMPRNAVEAMDLILINLGHLPPLEKVTGRKEESTAMANPSSIQTSTSTSTEVSSSTSAVVVPAGSDGDGGIDGGGGIDGLDSLVEAIHSNGASLRRGGWYERDGGTAWTTVVVDDDAVVTAPSYRHQHHHHHRNSVSVSGAATPVYDVDADQCRMASRDAFGRIVESSSVARSRAVRDFGRQVASRLAWTLGTVAPPTTLKEAYQTAVESTAAVASLLAPSVTDDDCDHDNNNETTQKKDSKQNTPQSSAAEFVKKYPLVSSCLALSTLPSGQSNNGTGTGTGTTSKSAATTQQRSLLTSTTATDPSSVESVSETLVQRILLDGYVKDLLGNDDNEYDYDDGPDDDPSNSKEETSPKCLDRYGHSLDTYLSCVAQACVRADDRPSDLALRSAAGQSVSRWGALAPILPKLTSGSLRVTSGRLCRTSVVVPSAQDPRGHAHSHGHGHHGGRLDGTRQTAAAHAGRDAAERRARTALLVLRDAACGRTRPAQIQWAVQAAVRVAAGSASTDTSTSTSTSTSTVSSQQTASDPALKLLVNQLLPARTDAVMTSAVQELERAARFAATVVTDDPVQRTEALERVRKPALLFMALCVRQIDRIVTLFDLALRPTNGPDNVFAEAVRSQMPIFARAVVKKYGAANIALRVADMVRQYEQQQQQQQQPPIQEMPTTTPSLVPMLLSFLDHLAPPSDPSPPPPDLVEACKTIQESQPRRDHGRPDVRFLIPVLSGMRRNELVALLPDFVVASTESSTLWTSYSSSNQKANARTTSSSTSRTIDGADEPPETVYRAALRRMGERLTRQTLHYRDEASAQPPQSSSSSGTTTNVGAMSSSVVTPSSADTNHGNGGSAGITGAGGGTTAGAGLVGMTACEQLVCLHRLDFGSVPGLSQKLYLRAIELCLKDQELFGDRTVMAALDHISTRFVEGSEGLPLAYMRTTMLTCSVHESLHSWICHILLPRLIEGRVYAAGRRQWEGWMRCANMLEHLSDTTTNTPHTDDGTSSSTHTSTSAAVGVSSIQAIQKLPPEQYRMYRDKYPEQRSPPEDEH